VSEWPARIDLGPEIVFFIALDGSALSDEEIKGFARKLFRQGAIGVVFSGKGGERVRHLLADVLGEAPERHAAVSVTVHSDADLDGALQSAVSGAGRTVVAIVVGQTQLAKRVAAWLVDPMQPVREPPSRDEIERKYQHVLELMDSLQRELEDLELIDPPQ
jgi:hypothetical protein